MGAAAEHTHWEMALEDALRSAPNFAGGVVLNIDGSENEVLGDGLEKGVASTIFGILQDAAAFVPAQDNFRRMSITFEQLEYTVVMAEGRIGIVKKDTSL